MLFHYSDVIMGAMASQSTSLTPVYSTVYSGADKRKHQNYAPLAFVCGGGGWGWGVVGGDWGVGGFTGDRRIPHIKGQ